MSKPELVQNNKNLYAQNCMEYIDKGYSAIPGKYMSKMPSIKAWSNYCHQLPTKIEAASWCRNFPESNVDIALGKASNLIALDIDTDDTGLKELILKLAPPSSVAKVGSKGLTLFYRYSGEQTQTIKFNGEMLVELLSTGKKTTIPPSIHPNGNSYKWRDNVTLLDIDNRELPLFPTHFFATLENLLRQKYPDFDKKTSKGFVSGRNNELSSLAGKLIQEQKPVDTAVKELVTFDRKHNDPPLFQDVEEMQHGEEFTNALKFYSNHLDSVNSNRYRRKEEYEVPVTKSAIDAEVTKEVLAKKSQKQGKLRKSNFALLHAPTVLKTLSSNILSNSWIKQDEFAFSASLILMSTLISRKVVFQGMSPNLYVLNIAPSGAGKNAPQEMLKKYFTDLGATSLLGAGDYVSDASLMDGLASKPVRLDIMDEAGGILKSINTGKSEYGGKMADILAELYTSSTAMYLGRATAEGTKGSCFRPNVNILASTTPAGFTEGISLRAIEKGLMGRFLIFQGDSTKPAERLRSFPNLDLKTRDHLRWWFNYQPKENNEVKIGGIEQMVTELECDTLAAARLDKIFGEFDLLRRQSKQDDPKLPIIARLYQQMVKLAMIHACARVYNDIPVITLDDINFGYESIMNYYHSIQGVIDKYIFNSPLEQKNMLVLNYIRENDKVSSASLARKFKNMTKKERSGVIGELVETEDIYVDVENVNGRNVTVYRSI
jgi:hypothetical protein